MSLVHSDLIAKTCHEAARSQGLIPDGPWNLVPRATRLTTLAAVEDYLLTGSLADLDFFASLTQTNKTDSNTAAPGTKNKPGSLTTAQQSRVSLCKSIIDTLR